MPGRDLSKTNIRGVYEQARQHLSQRSRRHRHSLLSKSKPTTSLRVTQQSSPPGPKRRPRGLQNSAFPFGEKTRTTCPSIASYSRTLVTASTAPNGRSLETTILPLGAIARSRGSVRDPRPAERA